MSAATVTPLITDPVAAPIDRPEYRVYDHPLTLDGMKLRAGVWHHGSKQDKETGDTVPFDEWLCGPLHVEAVTRNEGQDGDYGRLLRFRNQDGKLLPWAMPNELLAGRPDAILAVLLSMGLDVDYKRRNQVCQYIASQHPKRRVIAATSTGWHTPELFIMPREYIGTGDAIFQSETANGDDYRTAGTLESWQSTIGAWCEGNPLLILGVCTALAGPLLFHVKRQGGGFHYRGDSSIGKSTAMFAGNSVWGHGEDFKRTWRATGNGLEGVAAQRNDTLLSLDEIGEASNTAQGEEWGAGGPLFEACMVAMSEFIRTCPEHQLPDPFAPGEVFYGANLTLHHADGSTSIKRPDVTVHDNNGSRVVKRHDKHSRS